MDVLAMLRRSWPYALLAVLTIATVVIRRSFGESPAIDLVLCAMLAAWLLFRPPLPVLVVILAVLVVRAPWFGFFTPVAYVHAFQIASYRWRQAGVAAVAVVAGTAQSWGVDPGTPLGFFTHVAVIAGNVIPLCGFAWVLRRAEQRNLERIRALDEAREANRRLRETLADNAALHEQIVAQARAAGVHDERQRMAREIHDTLAQGLTGIISQLRAAEHAGDEWRRHVATATGLARESLTEARRSVHALRPEPLATARLGEALASVAGRWSEVNEIPVHVTTTGDTLPMRPEAEVALLRSAQEALANVAKHARATRVGLTLSYLENEVALDVRDDGRGFDPSAPPHESADAGFGLVAMRQRIESLSGTLQVESEPGAGTGISARVPVGRAS